MQILKTFINKIIALDDTNELFKVYFIFSAILCMALPDGLVFTDHAFMSELDLPFVEWVASVPGSKVFYREYLYIMWLVMPLWVLWFGLIYEKNYSSDHIKLIPLLCGWLLCIVFVFFVFYIEPGEFHESVSRRGRFLASAARSRVVGALVFPGLMGLAFLLVSAVTTKFPIDLYRMIKRHA